MKKYISPILSIATISLLFYTLFDLKEQVKQIEPLKKEIKSLENVKDSLHDEMFLIQTELMRHEITREEVLSKYKNIYNEYNTYLYTQTE
jgi:uncharacterized protein Yka (UPF0111/DUF47 family)